MKLVLFCMAVIIAFGCTHKPKQSFIYAAPEAKGFSTVKLDTLKAHLEQSGASSMMLLVDSNLYLRLKHS